MSPDKWKEYKIGQLCQVTSSKRIFSEEYVGEGIPFYRSKEIIEKSLGEEISEHYYISDKRFKSITNNFGSPKSGDILLSSVGNRSGIPYLVKEEDGNFYFKDGNLLWFKDFSKNISNKFLLYWFKSSLGQNSLNSIMIGSAQKALTIIGLSNLSIKLPPLSIQKDIAEILSSLDDKIELNRQTNATLEAIAQAIFEEWFVNFNFPGATGEMIESGFGLIPKGWKIGKLEDLVKISSGKGLQKNEFTETGYPVLGANGSIGYTDKYLLEEEVILTGRVGTLGTFQLVNEQVWISDNVLIMRPIKKENYYFSYFGVKAIDFRNLNRGSTQPLVTKTDLLNQQLLIPESSSLVKFDMVCRSLFNHFENNQQQSATLTTIRDALLPKLMSGEIEI